MARWFYTIAWYLATPWLFVHLLWKSRRQPGYRVPIDYPSKLLVELFSQRIGTTSLTVGHRIVSADGAVLHADGHVVMVWIDRATGRPVALPELLLKALG